ncbi:MAG: hypothetical protein JEZ09_21180 [Salinivirgaceae bacterium]|nr:hypothetical protein [Salinivirgaceae bacterium]
MAKLEVDSTLFQFIDTIKAKQINIFDHRYPIDSRTSLFYEIVEDFKIDSFDYKKIVNINQATMLDTL